MNNGLMGTTADEVVVGLVDGKSALRSGEW